MEQKIKVAVLGGGGRTGKYLVTQLLSQGYSVKLLLRSPEKFELQNPLIEIIKGDAIHIESIRSLMKDCQAIISTVGQRLDEPLVASRATLNVLSVMAELGVRRYILVAGLNVDVPSDKKSERTTMATEWMKSNFPLIHEDRQKTYSILSSSTVDWTLVRVPFIEFTDVRKETLISVEDCRGDKISAADIAFFLIEQLNSDLYIKKSPFIANA
jgi:putative NADH-flavin reductase